MTDVLIVLNTFNRRKLLKQQLAAVKSQSIPCDLAIWRNDNWKNEPLLTNLRCDGTGQNEGVWARFDYASRFDYDYYLIVDDDTIPGENFAECCLTAFQSEPSVYCAAGFEFLCPKISKKTWDERNFHGWSNQSKSLVRVDWPGHAWFFNREIMQEFQQTEGLRIPTCGEDMHLAFCAQQLGMNCYTMPYGKDRKTWGSLRGKLGSDSVATFRQKDQRERMIKSLDYYRERGWKWIRDK